MGCVVVRYCCCFSSCNLGIGDWLGFLVVVGGYRWLGRLVMCIG